MLSQKSKKKLKRTNNLIIIISPRIYYAVIYFCIYMPCNSLKVSIIPHDIVWGDKEENLLSVNHILSNMEKDVDVVVLPQLFSTGWLSDAEMVSRLSESNSSKTIETIKGWARKYNFAICGSFIASTLNKYYNRAFFIEPSGEETFYDKRHLSLSNGESELMDSGKFPSPIIRFRGWNLKLIAGDDLQYPIWCRVHKNDYDALLVVANISSAISKQWKHLLIGRAVENQAYVICANRTGNDDFGSYKQEDSIVVDYMGELNMRTKDMCIFAELDYRKLSKFREQIQIWKDADNYQILF